LTSNSTALTWDKLLNDERRPSGGKHNVRPKNDSPVRTEIERDGDRILFSTPLRRLDDKTQVFPLEQHDSVRNRLTHSHEVASLARSIGIYLAFSGMKGKVDGTLLPERNLPAMLYAISLVHDLGNPPFGHQGEVAIQHWFEANTAAVLDAQRVGDEALSTAMKQDFLRFEGNAQTFRLVSRLQIVNDDRGLNLTYGTLGALLKYTVPSDGVLGKDSTYAGARKHGYFQSEVPVIEEVRRKTGLSMEVRHPLTYVMEACDDIAYSVIDAEDALKKGLASFPDLLEWLQQFEKKDEPDLANSGKRQTLDDVIAKGAAIRDELRTSNAGRGLSPGELNDVSMQMFRAHVISIMVQAVAEAFVSHLDELMGGQFRGDLMSRSNASLVTARLKRFDKAVAYKNREVLRLEARGTAVIHELMYTFWASITDRVDPSVPGSARCTSESTYVYSRISENYRRAFEAEAPSRTALPLRYRECQLLTDMISGMTDRFAMSLHEEFKGQGFLRSRL
jgi:dGTPase